MRRKPQKNLILILAAGLFTAGLAGAQEQPESLDVPVPVVLCFADWATSLEQDTPATSVWQLPFAAPRPADLTDQELKLVLSLRRLVLNGDPAEMEPMADQVARWQGPMPIQMRFWLAYTQSQLGQQEACLVNLQNLLMTREGWLPLEKGQRAWVLTETADLLFLLDQRSRAADCYARLSVSTLDQLRLWGRYQLGGVAFLERDFARAGELYRDVCEGGKPATWRAHACSMASVADRLSRLAKVGEPRDAVAATHR